MKNPREFEIEKMIGNMKDAGVTNNPFEWRKKGAFLGLCSLDLPINMGGFGYSPLQMAHVFRRIGEIDLKLRDSIGLGHARILLNKDSLNDEQEALILLIKEGDAFLGVALTEENAGSDLRKIETTAEETDEGFTIIGAKKYILRVKESSHFLVFSKLLEPHQGYGLFIVPSNCFGVEISEFQPSVFESISFGEVKFDNVKISKEMLVGKLGDGLQLVSNHFSFWRAATSAACIGSAGTVLLSTIEWMQERDAFGGKIGRFSHIQNDLASYTSKLHMAWLLILSSMETINKNGQHYLHTAMAKSEAINICHDAVDWSINVFGARGLTHEKGLFVRLLDLKGMRIADGTTDLLRSQIIRGLLGDELYEVSLGRHRTNQKTHDLISHEILTPRNIELTIRKHFI